MATFTVDTVTRADGVGLVWASAAAIAAAGMDVAAPSGAGAKAECGMAWVFGAIEPMRVVLAAIVGGQSKRHQHLMPTCSAAMPPVRL